MKREISTTPTNVLPPRRGRIKTPRNLHRGGGKIKLLYRQLRKRYGRPGGQWSLWCKRPKTVQERELVIIESVLTQRANWNNVQQAVANLKQAGMSSLEKIAQADPEKLAGLIKPSGFYKQKAGRLRRLAVFFLKDCGGVEGARCLTDGKLRESLLSLDGIGPETADDILNYALDKPCFVVDEYTRRLAEKEHLTRDFSYTGLQNLFTRSIRQDFRLYQDFHALIVIDGKDRRGQAPGAASPLRRNDRQR